ncbi:unnamed protein product [marine sediment metagenome]|uniref:Uncharacterized protein n=1 Tax=marine sediment metagenome TaxID=412755 RepID=X1PC51_9ZZZZ
MRTKEEILDSTREDIRGWSGRDTPSVWMEYRKLEILIDIRDILEDRLKSLDNTILKYIIPK